MRLVLIAVTLASIVTDLTHACADSENQVPRFCWGGLVLYQRYCPNFRNYSSQYTCFGGSSLGCACKTLYRAIDGTCVTEDKCEAHAGGHSDIASGKRMKSVPEPARKTSGETANMPTDTVTGAPQNIYETLLREADYKTALQLIQSPHALELLMMSEEPWVRDDCLCLKSTWWLSGIYTAERTIDCYAYRTRLIVPPTIEKLAGTQTLIKITREVEVTVGKSNTGGITKVYLKPPQRANEVADVDKVLFGLWSEYNVLVAKTTCVTLTFTSLVDGKLHCMIWGTRSGDEIEKNDCYESSYLVCGKLSIAVENNGTDPCQLYDKLDDFTTNTAHNEEGSVI